MQIDILTLFPDMFDSVLNTSIINRAIESGAVHVDFTNFRQYGEGKHQIVDDTPYGGGAGMLLKPEPIFEAMEEIHKKYPSENKRVILFDPVGRRFDQAFAEELATEDHLIFICGHYEGYDERIRTLVTDEVSIGDYVLTGGELPAMVMTDAVVRLLPEVLGNQSSHEEDSFSTGLLEHPHYTKPREYRGMEVPEVLLSGHHANIEKWRHQESLKRTFERRPDLLEEYPLTEEDKKYLDGLKKD